MKNIAIYGGAFDPPHIGHIQLINNLTKLGGIDEIWLMPCGDRTDKHLLLPKEKRFTLMRQLFANNSAVKVSDNEIKISQQLGR
jgi:nicotinate-nucleotide adenylyltransferase